MPPRPLVVRIEHPLRSPTRWTLGMELRASVCQWWQWLEHLFGTVVVAIIVAAVGESRTQIVGLIMPRLAIRSCRALEPQ